jgi:hypothetical protein
MSTSCTVAPLRPSSKRDTIAVDLDEEIDRRLALLDAMGGILAGRQMLRQGRQVLGEIDQQVDSFLAIGVAEFSDDGVKCGRHVYLGEKTGPRLARAVGGRAATLKLPS